MIKKLAKFSKGYVKESILAPIFIGGEVLMEVLIPVFVARIVNTLNASEPSFDVIWQSAVWLVVCCLTSLLFGCLAGRFSAIASCGFAKNLRHALFDRVQTFSFKSIDKFSTASIVTRLTTDVSNLQNAYGMLIRIAFRAPLMLIFSLVAALGVNAGLSTVFLIAIPVLAIAIGFIVTRAHPVFTKVFKTYDSLNEVVQENLAGIRVVKSYVREDFENQKFGKVSKLIYDLFVKAEKIVSYNSPVMNGCIYSVMLLIAWLGAQIIIGDIGVTGGMQVGDLSQLITYGIQMLSSLMMVSMILVQIVMSRASAERCIEILEEQNDIVNPAEPVYEIKNGDIDFNDVCFRYSDTAEKNTLDHIDLHIKSGMTVGVLGGTGSAKSSLVQLIPRLYDVSEGSLTLGGVDVRNYDVTSLRDGVAMVLQKNELFSGTVADNLRWGNENATDEELIEACIRAQAHDFVSAMPDGYNTFIERGGTNVSGGQKQRLCIARALLGKPKVLILDDSTSAVDTQTDAFIRDGLKTYLPEATKIIIAQRVSSVQESDMIVVLDDGHIVDNGTHDELLQRCEIYREVYQQQTKGGK